MILGKLWKTRVCALQVYELNILYVPSFEHRICSWIPITSVSHSKRPLPVPSTPLEAICMLSAAEPRMPNIEELEQLAVEVPPRVPSQNQDVYKIDVEESESNNQAILWAALQQDDIETTQKVRFEEPVDVEEL